MSNVKPKDIVGVAEYLNKNYQTPASYRSVVSRSYYGVYHAFLSFLKIHWYVKDTGHQSLSNFIDAIKTNYKDNKKLFTFASYYSTLLTERNIADYELFKDVGEIKSSTYLAFSKKINEFLDDNEFKKELKKAINEYISKFTSTLLQEKKIKKKKSQKN